ncbi:UNKNOWN [Stylonychia lemnae]|uniref:Uncharacterized protein n=1 Tax=Stylonychia lemnae TaxID=5949 RepID=A0A078B223_STYLE|nr:UNKNOWN [Stylonychia lemnae]|eukprot:CDW88549.1 UNKNOWN [Stylonychia lemnae]
MRKPPASSMNPYARYSLQAANTTIAVKPNVSASFNASKYDGNCMVCINKGYSFCQDYKSCLPINATCPFGLKFNLTTGCPTQQGCNFGAQGIAYVANPNVTGGIKSDGSMIFNATANYPCYITLINDQLNKVQYNLVGNNITVQMMSIQYPNSQFSKSAMKLGEPYVIEPYDNMTYLYVGSLNNQQQLTRITWQVISGSFGVQQVVNSLSLISALVMASYYI